MKVYDMKRYEYEIKDGKLSYTGSYTIKASVKPLGFKNERLVQSFKCIRLEKSDKESLGF